MRLLPCVGAATAALALLAGPALGGSSSADAGAPPATSAAKSAGAHPPTRARIVFTKNHANPFRSKVTWVVRAYVAPKPGARKAWTVVERKTWRSGSGLGGKRGENSCIHNTGWLPNGIYRARQYDDYHGSVIRGRAFRLSDKACGNGTVRHELFIHTESGQGNRQCRNAPGDQPCRWEYPQINDYRSYGCVKMSPKDIAALTRAYHHWTRTARQRDLGTFRVRVTG